MSPLLPDDAHIAVVAPSGIHGVERFEAGLAIAREHGLHLHPYPELLKPHRYLAGSDDHRAHQLLDALTDPRWDAVWISRGGYGITRILDRIRPEALPPRTVIGFSDVTALFAALHPHVGPLVHGPVVHSLPGTDRASVEHLFSLLAGHPVPALNGQTWVHGEAEGWLCGGNLCMLATLCGTPWQLDTRGAIVVLEDVGEPAYRIDRMLQQLVSAGGLDGVAGVAVGRFVHCRLPDDADWALSDVILDHLEPLGVPVVGDLPIGHGPDNHAFPWGARAHLAHGRLAWS
jgi:muramoyltetrapeptide carboxypeptidase